MQRTQRHHDNHTLGHISGSCLGVHCLDSDAPKSHPQHLGYQHTCANKPSMETIASLPCRISFSLNSWVALSLSTTPMKLNTGPPGYTGSQPGGVLNARSKASGRCCMTASHTAKQGASE